MPTYGPSPARKPARLATVGVAALLVGPAFTASAVASPAKTDAHVRSDQTGPKPTIVLVHGAWADSSSWDQVVVRLQHEGFTIDVPPNPLRSVPYDSAYIADLLQSISGPIILVGHSYGGFVITNAATGNPNVKALVYIDAFIPAQGDTAFGLAGAQPGSCLGPDAFNFVPYPDAPPNDADTYLRWAPNGSYRGFADCFANGLPASEVALLFATQRPAALSLGSEPSGSPAWATIPSWDLIGTADHAIPPAEQLFMAKRASARVVEVDSGHLSSISHPDAVTDLIVEAATTDG